MASLSKKEFRSSLDITDETIEQYVPDLLEGIWDLGSMPDYVIELLTRNTIAFSNATDLGCGKGAVLINLAGKFKFNGTGVDVVPEFIETARDYAVKHGVADKILFKVEDLSQTIQELRNQDLVIYGYDSEILGDLKSTIHQLAGCVKDDGYIVLEFMFHENPKTATDAITRQEMIRVINESNCGLVDRIDWDANKLREVNNRNNSIIERNVRRLINLYPVQSARFETYFQNQLIECEALERDITCTTMLLRKQ